MRPPLPLASDARPARTGTFVHRVLEATDFAAADLDAELQRRVSGRRAGPSALGRRRSRTTVVRPGVTGDLETPLGPLLDGRRLRDVERADRLDELGFELPLVGGDTPTGAVTLPTDRRACCGSICPRTTRWPATRTGSRTLRCAGASAATSPAASTSSSVALGDDGQPRFAIVDYKTNWLGLAGEPLTAWHYRPAALAAEMQRAHYVLQALLYMVALHRYLRWRLPGYDPAIHLAGVRYLFLRGMIGAAHAGRRRRPLRGVRLAAARRRWWWRSATLLDREAARDEPGRAVAAWRDPFDARWRARRAVCCASSTRPA